MFFQLFCVIKDCQQILIFHCFDPVKTKYIVFLSEISSFLLQKWNLNNA